MIRTKKKNKGRKESSGPGKNEMLDGMFTKTSLIRQHLIRDLKAVEERAMRHLGKEYFRKKEWNIWRPSRGNMWGSLVNREEMPVCQGLRLRGRDHRGSWSFICHRKNYTFIPNKWESQRKELPGKVRFHSKRISVAAVGESGPSGDEGSCGDPSRRLCWHLNSANIRKVESPREFRGQDGLAI